MPLRKRHMQRNLAMLMGVPKTTVHCWIDASTICVHCNSLKPILTEENKWARLEMSLPFIDCKDPTEYQDMRERTHLDEKWFFLMWEEERYLLLPEERNPNCCTKHKSHITKVIFLCAVTRPHYNPCAKCWWDGKLGIWPFGSGNQQNESQRTGLVEHLCGRMSW